MRESMNKISVDEARLRTRLRRRLLRATLPAVRQLAQTAAGEHVFQNDQALRACITLARLVPVLIVQHPGRPERIEQSPLHPDFRGQEEEFVRRMNELRAEALAAKAREKEKGCALAST